MALVDVIAACILGAAMLRGAFVGAIREVFSIAGLVLAYFAIRLGTPAFSAWIETNAPVDLGSMGARIVAVGVIFLAVIVAAGVAGRLVRKGFRAAGLGMVDRLAGAVLAAAEGALVVAVLVLGISLVGGRTTLLDGSHTLRVIELIEPFSPDIAPGIEEVKDATDLDGGGEDGTPRE